MVCICLHLPVDWILAYHIMVSLLNIALIVLVTLTFLATTWSRPVQQSVTCKSIRAKCVSEQYPTKCDGERFKICWSHGKKQPTIYCESEAFGGHSTIGYIDDQCMKAMSGNDNDNMDSGDSHNPSANDHGRYDHVHDDNSNDNVNTQDIGLNDNNNVPDTDNNDDASENDTHRRDRTEGPNETINGPTKGIKNDKNQTSKQKSAASQASVNMLLVTILTLLAMMITGYS